MSAPPRDLISGASGFVGGRLWRALQGEGRRCRVLSRQRLMADDAVVADLAEAPDLAPACAAIERVFHCAGYAHAFSSSPGDAEARQWRDNFEATRHLVEAAGQAGVRCFVFLSSVKAMAEPGDACVDENLPGQPETAYGRAKRAAEEAVLDAGRRYGMRVVNLRLAMVYGRGGKGNLERMAALVKRGIFPPLPETGNHRSLVHVDDVVAAMRLAADDPRAAAGTSGTYIVAHRDAPSGRTLFDALRAVQGLPACRWSVPEALLRAAARIGDRFESRSGRVLNSEVVGRLLDSAWYSADSIERQLGWRARVSLIDGLAEMLRK